MAWRDARLRAFALIWIIGVFATMGVCSGRLSSPGSTITCALCSCFARYTTGRFSPNSAPQCSSVARWLHCFDGAHRSPLRAWPSSFGCLALYSVPILTGDWSGQIQTVQTSSQLQAFVQRTDAEPRTARILWLPIDQPMSPPNGRFAGLIRCSTCIRLRSRNTFRRRQSRRSRSACANKRAMASIVCLTTWAWEQSSCARASLPRSPPSHCAKRPTFRMTMHWSERAWRAVLALETWHRRRRGDRLPRAFRIVDRRRRKRFCAGLAQRVVAAFRAGAILAGRGADPAGDRKCDLRTAGHRHADRAVRPSKARLLAEGITLPSVDATQSWSPIEGWWYYRYAFSQALDASLISLGASSHQGAILHLNKVPAGARLIVGYVDSPFGGTLALDLPGTYGPNRHACSAFASGVDCDTHCRGWADTLRNLGGEQLFVTSSSSCPAIGHLRSCALPHCWCGRDVRRSHSEARRGSMRPLAPCTRFVTSKIFDGIGRRPDVSRAGLAYGPRRRRRDPASGKPPLPLRGAVSDIRASDFGELYSGVVAPHVRILRLRTTYSTGWELRLSDGSRAQHLAGDLFMNAWLLADSQSPRDFSIVYEPSWAISGLHRVSAYTLIALIVLSLGLGVFGRARKRCAEIREIASARSRRRFGTGRRPSLAGSILTAPRFLRDSAIVFASTMAVNIVNYGSISS